MPDLREIERASIRAFVQRAADEGYLSGRVLDYGCGKQPYRDIVEAAGGEYVPFDSPTFPGSTVSEEIGHMDRDSVFDSILCTQVLQYVVDPFCQVLGPFHDTHIERCGCLVLTYPTNWPEVEPDDIHRFTKVGMERLLTEAGFKIVLHEVRAVIYPALPEELKKMPPPEFALGYGVIARA